jgi:PAS domain S-box-containing protein
MMGISSGIDPTVADDSRYRLLVDSITDYAVFMLDREGRVTSWNPGAQRFKGYAAEEILGQHFSRFYTASDRAAGLPGEALRIAAEEGRFEREGWRVRKDGTRFWAHVVMDPIRSPEGELLGFAKITRDLTARRAGEEALRRSEQQFRMLVQGVTDYAIYMLDPEGRVSSWNAGAQRIKGYAPEEIIGQHFSRFYSEEDRARGIPDFALRTATAQGRFEREGWRVRKDGTRFWAHVVIDAIRDEAGEVIGFAKVTRDVTERQEAQRQLHEAREALLQSQKLEAIGQLTGGIAHDFNNLLMAVLGSLELLRKRLPPDPRARALLENAVQGAERGASLTQRMLAFARKQELSLGGVDVPELVRGMEELLQRALGPSIRVETSFESDLPPAFTDAAQLESALLNLAVNSRDAMPESGGAIWIEASLERVEQAGEISLPPGDYVRVAVVDNGVGMDEQTLLRATEPFYTTKGIGKGTGLGLSMVHGLAEQSGGRLSITSRRSEGVRVDIWLPKADALGAAPSLGPPLDEGAPLPSMTVLAVDDDELVLSNLVAMLEDLGLDVIPAPSAADALVLLEDMRPDMVVTDYAMPQMTGLQLAEEICRIRPGTPIVLSTGFAELAGAAVDLPRLAKPYTQADLVRVLKAAQSGRVLRTPSVVAKRPRFR